MRGNMEITFGLNKHDLKSFHQALYRNMSGKYPRHFRMRFVGVILAAGIVGLIIGLFDVIISEVVFSVFIAFVLIMIFSLFIRNTAIYKKSGEWTYGERTISLSDEGIRFKNDLVMEMISWNALQEIIQTKEHIFLIFDVNAGHIIPLSAFADSTEAERFLQEIRAGRDSNIES